MPFNIWQHRTSFANPPPRAQDCQDLPSKWDSHALNECSYTGHNRPRTGELKTWYYPVNHWWKLEKGLVLRLTPGVHRIKQGLDLRLDRLKLLVDCAQRAMSWSTCGWTLVSHSNQVFVIASCVGPCRRPLRNPWWSNLSACVPDSLHHPGCWWYRAQTEPTGFCGSFMFLLCLVFAMSWCASVYMCFVATWWERADLLALVCGV